MSRKRMDLIGQRFGRYTVIAELERDKSKNRRFLCRCDCGQERSLQIGNLRTGAARSCGCLAREIATKHGAAAGHRLTPEYQSWSAMKKRCSKPAYKNHHGRGIKVCERWLDFANFVEDMGVRPSLEHSLDRIDNDGDYEPENCRWATRTEQSNNTRVNRLLTFEGRTMTITEWSRDKGWPLNVIKERIRHGWDVESALTTPPIRPKEIVWGDRSMTVRQWAKEVGIPVETIQWRLKQGWSPEQALSTKPLRRVSQ